MFGKWKKKGSNESAERKKDRAEGYRTADHDAEVGQPGGIKPEGKNGQREGKAKGDELEAEDRLYLGLL